MSNQPEKESQLDESGQELFNTKRPALQHHVPTPRSELPQNYLDADCSLTPPQIPAANVPLQDLLNTTETPATSSSLNQRQIHALTGMVNQQKEMQPQKQQQSQRDADQEYDRRNMEMVYRRYLKKQQQSLPDRLVGGRMISGQTSTPRGLRFTVPETNPPPVESPRMMTVSGPFDECITTKHIPSYPPAYIEPPPRKGRYNFMRDPIDLTQYHHFSWDKGSLNVPFSSDKSKSLANELTSNHESFYASLGESKNIQNTSTVSQDIATSYPSSPPRQQSTGLRTSATEDGMLEFFSRQESGADTQPWLGTPTPSLPYDQSLAYSCDEQPSLLCHETLANSSHSSSSSPYEQSYRPTRAKSPLSQSRYFEQLPSATPHSSIQSPFSPSAFLGQARSGQPRAYQQPSTSLSRGYDHLPSVSSFPVHQPQSLARPAIKKPRTN